MTSRGGRGRRGIPVTYTCGQCGNDFTVMQGEGGHDEDIAYCWDCIGIIFAKAQVIRPSMKTRWLRLLGRLRCPHHREFCRGRYCCRDRHWRKLQHTHRP